MKKLFALILFLACPIAVHAQDTPNQVSAIQSTEVRATFETVTAA